MFRHGSLALLVGLAVLARVAAAQPTLDRLEDQVRKTAPGAAAPEGAAGAPTAPPAAPAPRADNRPSYLGLVVSDVREVLPGWRVLDVTAGGPADQAGIRAEDRLMALDGVPVNGMEDIARIVSERAPGTRLRVDLQRGQQALAVELTLGARPGEAAVENVPVGPASTGLLLGVRVVTVDPTQQYVLRLPVVRGAQVVAVLKDSPADRAGIPLNAVIVAVDGQRVDRAEDLTTRLVAAGAGKDVSLSYYVEGRPYERKVTLTQGAVTAERPTTAEPMPPGAAEPLSLPPPNEQAAARIAALEARLAALEARIRELEQALSARPAPTEPGQRPQ